MTSCFALPHQLVGRFVLFLHGLESMTKLNCTSALMAFVVKNRRKTEIQQSQNQRLLRFLVLRFDRLAETISFTEIARRFTLCSLICLVELALWKSIYSMLCFVLLVGPGPRPTLRRGRCSGDDTTGADRQTDRPRHSNSQINKTSKSNRSIRQVILVYSFSYMRVDFYYEFRWLLDSKAVSIKIYQLFCHFWLRVDRLAVTQSQAFACVLPPKFIFRCVVREYF